MTRRNIQLQYCSRRAGEAPEDFFLSPKAPAETGEISLAMEQLKNLAGLLEECLAA